MKLGSFRKIHFVGIGGIGMSAIAEILLKEGYNISGSDMQLTEITKRLETLGAKISKGHHAENVPDADLLVYTSAVATDNPEMTAARRREIPAMKRAKLLGEMMAQRRGIAIAGTHGKTTTASLVSTVLLAAKLDPTLVIGGVMGNLGSNAQSGNGEWLVAEADEYDRSLLQLNPEIAVITNIETDHLDCYADETDLRKTFIQFANKLPESGKLIVYGENEGVAAILQNVRPEAITYGFAEAADIRAANLNHEGNALTFDVIYDSENAGNFRLNLPGEHNVQNALAAIAVGREIGIDFETIREALAGFSGVERRFEIKDIVDDVMIVDDYAHHPTEIRATLEAAKKGWPGRRIVTVFQPHLYSRTQDFYREFSTVLSLADHAIVTKIYPAREKPIPGVSGEMIIAEMEKNGSFIAEKSACIDYLTDKLRPGDMLLTIGAGDIGEWGKEIIHRLQEKQG